MQLCKPTADSNTLKNKQIIGEVGVQWTATPMPKLSQVGVSSSILLESPTNT